MIDQTKLEGRLIATDTSKKFPELVTLVNHTYGELLKIGTQNLCKNTPMEKYIDAPENRIMDRLLQVERAEEKQKI